MKKLPIFHVIFPTRQAMNLAMGRVSEYNENPVLARRVFTWDELNAWWRTTSHGKRTAFIDYWDGFNIPVAEFKPLLDGRFADLNAEERALLRTVRRLPKDACVISTAVDVPDTLSHEVVHGLYAHLPKYRRAVGDAVRAAMRKNAVANIIAALRNMGYGAQTFVNEINAYLVTKVEPGERMYGPGERELRRELLRILRAHLGYDLRGARGHARAAALVHDVRFSSRA